MYGDAGCDSDGYRLRTDGGWGDWDNSISGFTAQSGCNSVTGYDPPNLSGDRETWTRHKPCTCADVPWVGDYMNDRIECSGSAPNRQPCQLLDDTPPVGTERDFGHPPRQATVLGAQREQRRVDDHTDDLHRIACVSEAVRADEARLREAVGVARAHGRSWSQIALALGVSRQAARQRFGDKTPA